MTVEHNNHCLKDLITNNNIAENTRFIQGAIQASTIAEAETDNRNATAILKAISDANVAGINATSLSGVSVTKNVNDGTVSTNKNVYDGVVSNINATNLNGVSVTKTVTDGIVSGLNATNLAAVATQKAISDANLANTLAFGAVNSSIAASAASAAMNAKDIELAIYKDGAHIREEAAEAIGNLEKEMLKGNAAIELQAERNARAIELQAERLHAATAAQIAKCCCEGELREKDTQALIIKQTQDRKNDEIMELRFKLLAAEGKIPTVAVAV